MPACWRHSPALRRVQRRGDVSCVSSADVPPACLAQSGQKPNVLVPSICHLSWSSPSPFWGPFPHPDPGSPSARAMHLVHQPNHACTVHVPCLLRTEFQRFSWLLSACSSLQLCTQPGSICGHFPVVFHQPLVVLCPVQPHIILLWSPDALPSEYSYALDRFTPIGNPCSWAPFFGAESQSHVTPEWDASLKGPAACKMQARVPETRRSFSVKAGKRCAWCIAALGLCRVISTSARAVVAYCTQEPSGPGLPAAAVGRVQRGPRCIRRGAEAQPLTLLLAIARQSWQPWPSSSKLNCLFRHCTGAATTQPDPGKWLSVECRMFKQATHTFRQNREEQPSSRPMVGRWAGTATSSGAPQRECAVDAAAPLLLTECAPHCPRAPRASAGWRAQRASSATPRPTAASAAEGCPACCCQHCSVAPGLKAMVGCLRHRQGEPQSLPVPAALAARLGRPKSRRCGARHAPSPRAH